MVTITLPDDSKKQYQAEVTPGQVAAEIGPGLRKAARAARVDGELWDLERPVETDRS